MTLLKLLTNIFLSACLILSPVLGDKDYQDRDSKVNIDSNKKGFTISSLPKEINPESFSFRFQAQDNSNSFQIKYQIFDSSNLNGPEASEYKIRMYNLIQFIESDNGIPGLDPTDTICNSQYSPYSIGGTSFVFNDFGIVNIDGVGVKEISAEDVNGILNFIYKFSIPSTELQTGVWKYGNGNRQFVDATSVKFDMIINTDAVTNFYAKNSECNGLDSSQIKLALTAFTKSRFRYPVSTNQTTDDDRDDNSDYRTVVNFGVNAGFFTWEPVVQTDKGNKNVLASPLQRLRDDDDDDDDDDVRRVIWTFNVTRPTYIHWDPQIGYIPTSDASGVLFNLQTAISILFFNLIMKCYIY